MTPPEKPHTGPDTTAESDVATVVVTAEEVASADVAETNGQPKAVADSVSDSDSGDSAVGDSAVEDDGQAEPAPPWQRMNGEAETAQPEEPAAESSDENQPPVAQDDESAPTKWPVDDETSTDLGAEDTVRVERPVVTGAAAGLFGGMVASGARSPSAGYTPLPPRTPVNLEGTAQPPKPRVGGMIPPSALRRTGRGPRRANLQIKRFDPWSVLKLSLVLGVALFFVWLVAVGALYAVLDGMGVWDKVNGISTELLQQAGDSEPLISAGRVFGVAAIIGAVNIVLFSALATVGAFVYNVSADLAGGLEVTLAERE